MSKDVQQIHEDKIWYQRGKTHYAHVYHIGDGGGKEMYQHRIHDSSTGHEVHRDVHNSLSAAKKAVFSHFERLDKESINEMRRIPGAKTHPEVRQKREQEAAERSKAFVKDVKNEKEEKHARAKLHEEQDINNLIGLVASRDLISATEITTNLLNGRVVAALDDYKKEAAKTLFSPIELEEEFHVYDNGGETHDRYTAFTHKDHTHGVKNKTAVGSLGLSHNPTHPQGFSQHTEAQPGKHLGKKVKFDSLPDHIKTHIKQRLSE